MGNFGYIFGYAIIFSFLVGAVVSYTVNSIIENIENKVNKKNNTEINNDIDEIIEKDISCYENGEITNLCTIIALKGIKREMKTMLSNIEKDAIEKAVDNTIRIEKLKTFVDNNDIENVDIDE